jgi:uncharacterized protein YecE (DUF72 family)
MPLAYARQRNKEFWFWDQTRHKEKDRASKGDCCFYPPNLENSEWLRFYSQIFDYVEIDSSFYRIPNRFAVKNWVKRTPDNFRFTAKFPKVITHDKYLVDVDMEIGLFLNNINRKLQH